MRTTDAYADRTLAAYRARARAAIVNWRRHARPSRFLRQFAAALPPRSRVLDYGCGIGLELAWLRRQGFQVEGVDGALEFVLEARRRCPGVPIAHARFETVPVARSRYDGIWCQAALIHVPPDILRRQLDTLRRGLTPGGVLGLTLAWGTRKGYTRGDWIPGRYLAGYTKAQVVALLHGWTIRDLAVVAHDGRHGRWIQLLCQSP